MTHVTRLQFEKIAAAQLAVDSKGKECQLSRTMLQLQANSNGPDVLEPERRLLSDNLSFVPGSAMVSGIRGRDHDDVLLLRDL